MPIQPHPSLAVSIAAVRELIEHSLRSHAAAAVRRVDDVDAQALELALEGLAALWQALEAQRQDFARERERCAEFFDYAPEACLLTDVNGVVLLANRAAAELLQAAPEALLHKSLAAFIAEDERGAFRCRLAGLSAHDDATGTRRWRSAVRRGEKGRTDVEVSVRCVRPAQGGGAIVCWLLAVAS